MDKIYGRKPVLDTLDTDIKIYKAYILKQNSKLVNKIIGKLEEKILKYLL